MSQAPNNLKITISATVAELVNEEQNHETLEEYVNDHPDYVGFFTASFLDALKLANGAPTAPIVVVSSTVLQLTPTINGVPPSVFKLDTKYSEEYPLIFVGTGPNDTIEEGEQTIAAPCPPLCSQSATATWNATIREKQVGYNTELYDAVKALDPTKQILCVQHNDATINIFDKGIWRYLFNTYFIYGDENPAKRIKHCASFSTINISPKTQQLFKVFRNELRQIYSILPSGTINNRLNSLLATIQQIRDELKRSANYDAQFYWDMTLFQFIFEHATSKKNHHHRAVSTSSSLSNGEQLIQYFNQQKNGCKTVDFLMQVIHMQQATAYNLSSTSGVQLISGVSLADTDSLDERKFNLLSGAIEHFQTGENKRSYDVSEYLTRNYADVNDLMDEMTAKSTMDENTMVIYSHRTGSDIALTFKDEKKRIDNIGNILYALRSQKSQAIDTLLLLNCGFDLQQKIDRVRRRTIAESRVSKLHIISFNGLLYRIRYETFMHMYFMHRIIETPDELGYRRSFEIAKQFSDIFKLSRGSWSDTFII